MRPAVRVSARMEASGKSRARNFQRKRRLLPDAFIYALVLLVAGALAASAGGCRGGRNADEQRSASSGLAPGVYPVKLDTDCLPDVTLTDASGRAVSLASLRGKYVLVDFIYTSCPGPCELMTARIAKAVPELGDKLGRSVEIVSITLDPERDDPKRMLDFAREQGALVPGWLFLTGAPEKIESVMRRFKLERRREADGSIDHITILYLLGPDGRPVRMYDPATVTPKSLAADIGALAASLNG